MKTLIRNAISVCVFAVSLLVVARLAENCKAATGALASTAPGQTTTNRPPEIELLFPAERVVTLIQRFNVRARASDPDGSVTEVRFYSYNRLVGVVTNPPYVLPWFIENIDEHVGFDLVSAVAVDNLGATNRAGPIPIQFVTYPDEPSFVFITPLPGNSFFITNVIFAAPATFSMSAKLEVTDTTENIPVFYLGTNIVGVALGPPYSVVATNISDGHYLLNIATTNRLGQLVFSDRGPYPQYVTVVPLLIEKSQVATDQSFSFRTSGRVAGKATVIEASTNLVNWEPIATNITSTNSFLFVDPQSTNFTRRFYRASFKE